MYGVPVSTHGVGSVMRISVLFGKLLVVIGNDTLKNLAPLFFAVENKSWHISKNL